MQFKKIILLCVILTGLATNPSYAVAPGAYIEAMLGLSKTTTQPDINTSNKSQLGGGLLVGYLANQYFASEFGYMHFANASNSAAFTCGSPVIHSDALVLDFRGIFPLTIFGNVLGVYGKGGIAAVRNTGGGSCDPNVKTSTTSARALVGAGAMYDLTQNCVFDIGWTRLLMNTNLIQYSDLITLGVSYHFVDTYCGQFLC